jgi:hypothetical protein
MKPTLVPIACLFLLSGFAGCIHASPALATSAPPTGPLLLTEFPTTSTTPKPVLFVAPDGTGYSAVENPATGAMQVAIIRNGTVTHLTATSSVSPLDLQVAAFHGRAVLAFREGNRAIRILQQDGETWRESVYGSAAGLRFYGPPSLAASDSELALGFPLIKAGLASYEVVRLTDGVPSNLTVADRLSYEAPLAGPMLYGSVAVHASRIGIAYVGQPEWVSYTEGEWADLKAGEYAPRMVFHADARTAPVPALAFSAHGIPIIQVAMLPLVTGTGIEPVAPNVAIGRGHEWKFKRTTLTSSAQATVQGAEPGFLFTIAKGDTHTVYWWDGAAAVPTWVRTLPCTATLGSGLGHGAALALQSTVDNWRLHYLPDLHDSSASPCG